MANDLNRIRACFPSSSGIQILVSGYAILLYKDAVDMNISWSDGMVALVGIIGGLILQHSIDN
jgi:hypothetical protein